MELTRRSFLVAAGLAGAGIAGCGGSESQGAGASGSGAKRGRVVILGFDGVEPTIVRKLIDDGKLPNLAKIESQGSFKPLTSTTPPQSPVAWTSFTTCVNPGGHNIFDFIRRNPAGPFGPLPAVGTGEVKGPLLSADGTVQQPAAAKAFRMGTSFWKVADDAGLRCKVFNVPFAFPADELTNGVQLCGLGVSDLRETTSTSYSLSEKYSESQSLSGHVRMPLKFDGSGNSTVDIPGPRDRRNQYGQPGDYPTVRLNISIDRSAGEGRVSSDGNEIQIKTGTWSEWLPLGFIMKPNYPVQGIVRFFPIAIGNEVEIYMTCTQFHPDAPLVPITEPPAFSGDLRERYGLYKTIGWAFDTHALRQDGLHEDAFLLDTADTMAWRERLTLDELDRGEFDLLISAWTATDRLGHMFWRFRDEKHPMYTPEGAAKYATVLEDSYIVVDRIIGNVLPKLRDNDLLMILSDHGFESFRQQFDVNRWLVNNGFMTVSDDPEKAKQGALTPGGIDWTKTQAYSMGLSSMYLNLAGRERHGIVSPAQANATIDQIREKLVLAKDPNTGDRVFSEIYTRNDMSGPAMKEAPDFSFGFTNAYQTAKSTALGGVTPYLVDENRDKWSGEHAASDRALLPGILFANQNIEKDSPIIEDLGVTALRYLGVDIPSEYEGDALV